MPGQPGTYFTVSVSVYKYVDGLVYAQPCSGRAELEEGDRIG